MTTAVPVSDPSRVVLRPVDLAVARAVLRNRRGDDWTPGYPTQADRELCELLIQRAMTAGAASGKALELFSPNQVVFMQKVVGSIGCHQPPGGDATVEIGYGLAPEWRGRGLATTAVALLVSRLFETGIATVIACTDEDNLASQAVLRRNGFRVAGEGRDGSILWSLTTGRYELMRRAAPDPAVVVVAPGRQPVT